jgi:hypothetical protein
MSLQWNSWLSSISIPSTKNKQVISFTTSVCSVGWDTNHNCCGWITCSPFLVQLLHTQTLCSNLISVICGFALLSLLPFHTSLSFLLYSVLDKIWKSILDCGMTDSYMCNNLNLSIKSRTWKVIKGCLY